MGLDNWKLLQDRAGNGTKDFCIFNTATNRCSADFAPVDDTLTVRRIAGSVVAAAFSAKPIFDLSLGDQVITLSGDVVLSSIINVVKGQRVVFKVCQDAAGSHTFVPPANMTGFTPIATAAGKCSAQMFESFDGNSLTAIAAGVVNQ